MQKMNENRPISICSESHSIYSVTSRKCKKPPTFEQAKFSNNIQFFLYTLAYTISIDSFSAIYKVGDHRESNVLRCLVVYILVGIPLYYMQMILGQFCLMSMIHFKHLIPLGHGLIYTTLFVVYLYMVRYGVYLGEYCLFFMIAWQKNLPWMICHGQETNNLWGKCFSGLDDDNATCPNGCVPNGTYTSAFLYYVGTYLHVKPEEIQYFTVDFPNVQRTIALVTAWSIIFLFTGFVYPRRPKIIFSFVAVFYILLILLNMGTISTKGGFKGIDYLFRSDWNDLKDLKIWFGDIPDVVAQLRLSHAFIILNASRLKNRHANNPGTLSVFICIITFVTNICCSLFLQSCIGMVVRRTNSTLTNVANIGVTCDSERLFVLIPQSLGYLTVPQIWSLLYFMCAISTILANEVTHINTIHCSLVEVWPSASRFQNYITLAFCVTNCLIGFAFMGESNYKVSSRFAEITATLVEMVNISFMSIVVCWIYGIRRLADDICFMYGTQPTKFWKITWYLMPFVTSVSTYYRYSYYMVKVFPGKYNFFVRVWLVATVSPIAILIFIEIFKHMRNRNLIGLCRPTVQWGPPDLDERQRRMLFNPKTNTTFKCKVQVCQHNCLLHSKILKSLKEPEVKCTSNYLQQIENKKTSSREYKI